MAKVHMLDSIGQGAHNCIAHCRVPAANNRAGLPWATVLKAVGATGNPARVSTDQEEAEAIAAGSIAEVPFVLQLDPSKVSSAALSSAIEAQADKAIADWLAQMRARHDNWGTTYGKVT